MNKRDKLVMALLGFSSGLLTFLVTATFGIRMADCGVDVRAIGLLSLTGIPYMFRFFWMPLLDCFSAPILGRRRCAMLVNQTCAMLLCIGAGVAGAHHVVLAALLNFSASFFASLEDATVHAFRIESLPEESQAPAVSLFYSFWRGASVLAISGPIILAHSFYSHFPTLIDKDTAWKAAIILVSLGIFSGIIGALLAHEKELEPRGSAFFSEPFSQRLRQAASVPIKTFISRQGWALIFLFTLMHGMGEAGIYMFSPFLVHKGYGLGTYGFLAITEGLAAIFLGAFLANHLLARVPLKSALVIAAAMHSVMYLYFALLAFLPLHAPYLILAVALEYICVSMAIITFVVWASRLCESRRFTATEMALFLGIVAMGRTLLPAPIGFSVSWIGYGGFFLCAAGFGVLSLLPLVVIKNEETRSL